MAMSRHHFQKIADALKEEAQDIVRDYADAKARRTTEPFEHLEGRDRTLERLTSALADVCASENPNFDRARFLAACQPKPRKE